MNAQKPFQYPLSLLLKAKSTGYLADQVLAACPPTTINGVTSQGLFLTANDRHVIFISFGSFRSPLTINLGIKSEQLASLQTGEAVLCRDGEVLFPNLGVKIAWNNEQVWQVPPPNGHAAFPAERIDTLHKIIRGIRKIIAGEPSFKALLPHLMGDSLEMDLPAELIPVQQILNPLQVALRRGDVTGMLDLFEHLLGYGRGLTPSGDDFTIGFLLALNRWRADLHPHFPVADLNRYLVNQAQVRTTRLSANMIEMASTGAADERLIRLLDCLMQANTKQIEESIYEIAGLGRSSGIDTLAGMATVLVAAG